MPYLNGPAGRNRSVLARSIQSFAAGSPPLGTAADILAATASAAVSTVTTGITQPGGARNLVATPGGTAANVLAVSVVVNGTDINGAALSETLPAFTAGALTPVVGVKAFKAVTSVVLPIVGAATTVSIGRGAKLGMPYPMNRATVLNAWLGGVREATAPTVNTNAVTALTTVQLASALNGTAVVCDYYES